MGMKIVYYSLTYYFTLLHETGMKSYQVTDRKPTNIYKL
jgi:hypothetical protein